jgi:hypothetical protein
MSLNSLLEIVRARRQAIEAGGVPRIICIWVHEGRDSAEQQIAAMIASGEAKPTDKFHTVRWLREGEGKDGFASDNQTSRK